MSTAEMSQPPTEASQPPTEAVVEMPTAEMAMTPPRYVIGFSTGHVGTTTLCARSSYECICESRAWCKCVLSKYGFAHELGRRKGLQSDFATLCEWHEAPLADGEVLADREAALVAEAYLPRWNKHTRAIVLSHDTLLYYQGILRVIPHDELLFVRIRRARDEFVASFSKYDSMARDWYALLPSSHDCCTPPLPPEAWEQMDMRDKAGWFFDEVEARWQRLRAEHPQLAVLEMQWSKNQPDQYGSFDAMAASVARAAGLRIRSDIVPHRRAGSVRQQNARPT
tara:strand:- start:1236 stop:2081 length:846 start_codon:yes stop_codon:yes gene_type:complete